MSRRHIIVSLGSNCGDRAAAVAKAMEWLRLRLNEFRESGIYETPSCGHAGSNYMNAVVSGKCICDLPHFEKECKLYEESEGRDGECRRLNLVPIDIDVVVCDDMVLRPKDYAREFFKIGYRQITS